MRRLVAAAWLGLCAAGVLPAAGVQAEQLQQLLVNGDFDAGQGAVASGWTFGTWPEAEPAVSSKALVRSSVRARGGTWALRLDTGSLLGSTKTLFFNGAVAHEAAALRGKRVDFSGWVFVEPDAAIRPFRMELRVWGKGADGKTVLAGVPFSVAVLGKPGQWTAFTASGLVPDAEITDMDLHCHIRPDIVRTVQFIDDLRLSVHEPPLEISLPVGSVWRDTAALAVEVRSAAAVQGPTAFSLVDGQGRTAAKWEKSAKAGIVGLPLPKALLPEGAYTLRAEVRGSGGESLAASAPVELVASPWEGQAEVRDPSAMATACALPPEAFQVMGTVAPTDLPDAAADQAEPLAEDVVLPDAAKRGYVVFARHPQDEVPGRGRPRPGETGALRLFGCAGQYLTAAVSVWAIAAQDKVRVSVSDLTGSAGTVLAGQCDVRVVRRMQGLPAFLEKRSGVDVPAGQTQPFWLTVRVPLNAAPGLYGGQVEVAPGAATATRVRLLLRVLPLDLPPVKKGYGFWWKMDNRWQGYYSQDRAVALEQVRKQMILLREHGCNMVSIHGTPKMTRAADGSIAFDFDQDHFGHDSFSLADLARVGRETRFFSPDTPIQYAGVDGLRSDWTAKSLKMGLRSKGFDAFFRDACRRIDEWAKGQGLRLAFACVDEIGNSEERVQEALKFYRLAGEAGVLTSVTDNSMHGGVHLAGQKRFSDILGMRLYNFICPEMIDSARAARNILWLYNMGSMGGDPRQERFAFGLLAERCGADGVAQWAFQWPNGNASPYEAAAARTQAGYHYALPAPDGPLPTLGLEAVRDGIDDARYFALLKSRSSQAAAAAIADIEPDTTRAAEYLANHAGNSYDVRRWKMARAVIALPKAMKGVTP